MQAQNQAHYPVVIIGGGQAGLSVSYCLKERNIDHILFEKEKIAHSWGAKRWDSFCLVTPNWQCQLPGFSYAGDDPQGFMGRDAIVEYIVDYARSFNPPIREGVEVLRVKAGEAGGFAISTSIGEYTADQVVVATGGYHTPKIPAIAHRLPDSITQLHSSQYKNPDSLPAGSVMVVGTGQSGCQIAEDLHRAGRQVHLCVGSAPRSPRTYRGKDVVDWLHQMGYYDLPIDEHPQKETVRAKTNHYVSGRDGGKEIDLRQFALEGMQLHGRLQQIQGTEIRFIDDLKQNLDQADAVAESIKRTIDQFIQAHHIAAPEDTPFVPVWEPTKPQRVLDTTRAQLSTIIWATGYHMDFRWIELPVFDGKGYPGHDRGITPYRGLYFLGLPWLYTWGSGRFSGIARDARYLTDCIASRQQVSHPDLKSINEVALGS